MLAYLNFPKWISPVIIPGLPLRWYGMMYLVAFAITMAFFGRTVNDLFTRHGADLAPWIRWLALGLVALLVLFLVRRVVRKAAELRETWQDLGRLKSELSQLPEDEPPRAENNHEQSPPTGWRQNWRPVETSSPRTTPSLPVQNCAGGYSSIMPS